MYCSNCGKENSNENLTCTHCGHALFQKEQLVPRHNIIDIPAPVLERLDTWLNNQSTKDVKQLENENEQNDRNYKLDKLEMEISERTFNKTIEFIKLVTLIVLVTFLLTGIGLIFILKEVNAGMLVIGFIVTLLVGILGGQGVKSALEQIRKSSNQSGGEDE